MPARHCPKQCPQPLRGIVRTHGVVRAVVRSLQYAPLSNNNIPRDFEDRGARQPRFEKDLPKTLRMTFAEGVQPAFSTREFKPDDCCVQTDCP
jgi:hypothetical protein